LVSFELIPNNIHDELKWYESKLKDFENMALNYSENGYEIPNQLLSNGCNYSANIRNLKKRIEGLKN